MLKTLEEHNAEARKRHCETEQPHPNRIACPECGGELIDSEPGVTLNSNPPKKNVICLGCGYRGYRVA